MTRVLHLALAEDWEAAVSTGHYAVSTRGRTLADEGFIHASTLAQALVVRTRFYGDLPPEALRLLVVDVEACRAAGTPMRWDDVPGADRPFPHLYGPIPMNAVVAVLPFTGPSFPDVSSYGIAG